MSASVLKCPLCSKPFRVLRNQATQVVECPSCKKKVSVPPLKVAEKKPAKKTSTNEVERSKSVQETSVQEKLVEPKSSSQPKRKRPPIVFACPKCRSKFGVTKSMLGRSVACPHCKSTVKVTSPQSDIRPQKRAANADADATSSKSRESKKVDAKKRKKATVKNSGNAAKGNDVEQAGLPEFKQVEGSKKSAAKSKSKVQPRSSRPSPDDAEPMSGKKKGRRSAKKSGPAGSETNPVASSQPVDGGVDENAGVQAPSKPEKPGGRGGESVEPSKTRLKRTASQFDSSVVGSKGLEKIPADQAVDVVESERSPESRSETDDELASAPVEFVPHDISHLLPPKFDVDDPERLTFSTGKDAQRTVFLPDGEGGLAKFDERMVTVEHKGESVELVNLTPAQRRTRRLIQNVVVATLLMALLLVVFWFLRKTA